MISNHTQTLEIMISTKKCENQEFIEVCKNYILSDEEANKINDNEPIVAEVNNRESSWTTGLEKCVGMTIKKKLWT